MKYKLFVLLLLSGCIDPHNEDHQVTLRIVHKSGLIDTVGVRYYRSLEIESGSDDLDDANNHTKAKDVRSFSIIKYDTIIENKIQLK